MSNLRRLLSACAVATLVLRKYSITPMLARENTRDASHPVSLWHARQGLRRSDAGVVESKGIERLLADRAHLVLAPCEDAIGCNGQPIL